MKKIIEDIAKRYLRFDTIETRNSDRLDFKEVAVWNVKEALEAAFKAGENSGYVEATDKEFPDFSKMCNSHHVYPCVYCHTEDYNKHQQELKDLDEKLAKEEKDNSII